MIAVTGATGQLGKTVVKLLLETIPASEILALVRNPQNAEDLAGQGVEVRQADYSRPASLRSAFEGVEKVLLISSSEVGQRVPQHQAVTDAARAAGATLLAYTSILEAEISTLLLAKEHQATESYIRASGLPFTFLRNGWYTENHTASLAAAVEHGALLGAAGNGRFSTASRADYAAAAASVLLGKDHENRIYELGGDASYTLTELAAEAARQSRKSVIYRDLSQTDFAAALIGLGLPEGVAEAVADADRGARQGELETSSRDLSTLIGRATTPMQDSVAAALAS